MDEKKEFDDLKKRLKKTGNQKKRRKILAAYNQSFLDNDYKLRYEKLVIKANQSIFLPKVICIWGILLYLPAWIVTVFVGFPILKMEESTLSFFLELILLIPSLWCIIGPAVVVILTIITLVARNNDKYYLNIKNI